MRRRKHNHTWTQSRTWGPWASCFAGAGVGRTLNHKLEQPVYVRGKVYEANGYPLVRWLLICKRSPPSPPPEPLLAFRSARVNRFAGPNEQAGAGPGGFGFGFPPFPYAGKKGAKVSRGDRHFELRTRCCVAITTLWAPRGGNGISAARSNLRHHHPVRTTKRDRLAKGENKNGMKNRPADHRIPRSVRVCVSV